MAAMAVFAVAYPGIRYACEAKQYGGRFVLLAAADRAHGRVVATARATALAVGTRALLPVAVTISYPAVFVGGAISLFVAARAADAGRPPRLASLGRFQIAMAGSFGLLFALSAARAIGRDPGEHAGDVAGRLSAPGPPVEACLVARRRTCRRPAGLSVWRGNGGSTLTLVCVAVAVVVLCRRRQFGLVFLCLAPLGLTLVAAALRRYPYGQMVRFQIYMAPAFCLLGGIGGGADRAAAGPCAAPERPPRPGRRPAANAARRHAGSGPAGPTRPSPPW